MNGTQEHYLRSLRTVDPALVGQGFATMCEEAADIMEVMARIIRINRIEVADAPLRRVIKELAED